MHQQLTQCGLQMVFSFHNILVRFTARRGSVGLGVLSLWGGPQPVALRQSAPKGLERSISRKTESQKPKKKALYVRKEFPETWLWTEEIVK